jgi:hypothetical protein
LIHQTWLCRWLATIPTRWLPPQSSCGATASSASSVDESLPGTATLEFVQFDSTYLLNINDIDTSGRRVSS